MISSEQLADRMTATADALRSRGGLTWERVDAWTKAIMPRLVEPLSDEQDQAARDGASDEAIDERLQDDAASRYKAEVEAIAKRLDADLARLKTIIGICNPDRKELGRKDMLPAQLAADGLCVSCYRADQCIKWRETRNRNGVERPIHRELCRWCHGWKAEHGSLPPVPLLRVYHQKGRQMTTADVAKALGQSLASIGA